MYYLAQVLKDNLKVLKERLNKHQNIHTHKSFKVPVIQISIDDNIKICSASTLIFLKVKKEKETT